MLREPSFASLILILVLSDWMANGRIFFFNDRRTDCAKYEQGDNTKGVSFLPENLFSLLNPSFYRLHLLITVRQDLINQQKYKIRNFLRPYIRTNRLIRGYWEVTVSWHTSLLELLFFYLLVRPILCREFTLDAIHFFFIFLFRSRSVTSILFVNITDQ